MSDWHPWYGVDLDGTLAYRDKNTGYDPAFIGAPLAPMVQRIKYWLSKGLTVKIFTARATTDGSLQGNAARRFAIKVVQDWLESECGLPRLEVTNQKDYQCVAIWDDIAVSMIHNTGMPRDQLP